jgi:hypothetical protein
MPDAWKRQREQYRINGAAQRNAPTLNEPARSTGGDAGLLKYAVYLYAIQQAYGQDTAKVRQALQQYIQATGDRNGVNQLFNSVKQEVSTNRAVADSLAQKLLNPETSNAIISRLLQSVAGAGHEEF